LSSKVTIDIMLSVNVFLGLFAAIAAASPVQEAAPREYRIEPDGREVYIVRNATSAAIWDEPGSFEAGTAVEYRCFSGGLGSPAGMEGPIGKACSYLKGGYATNQEKKTCNTISLAIKLNANCWNTVGGRNHEYAHCVDRLSDIWHNCDYGGRVNRANWEMLWVHLRCADILRLRVLLLTISQVRSQHGRLLETCTYQRHGLQGFLESRGWGEATGTQGTFTAPTSVFRKSFTSHW
jgi:hypothetical protein